MKEAAKREITAENLLTEKIPVGDILSRQILAKEILEMCEGTVVSLAAQLEIRINPNYTPPIRIAKGNSTVPSIRITSEKPAKPDSGEHHLSTAEVPSQKNAI